MSNRNFQYETLEVLKLIIYVSLRFFVVILARNQQMLRPVSENIMSYSIFMK